MYELNRLNGRTSRYKEIIDPSQMKYNKLVKQNQRIFKISIAAKQLSKFSSIRETFLFHSFLNEIFTLRQFQCILNNIYRIFSFDLQEFSFNLKDYFSILINILITIMYTRAGRFKKNWTKTGNPTDPNYHLTTINN